MTRIASHLVAVAGALILASCTGAAAQAVPLTGASKTMAVKGQYQPLRLDEVDGVSLKGSQLIVRGSFESVTIDLPAVADPAQVTRHWALVTESSQGERKILNFTHDESLDDFTLDVPLSEGEIRYGVFVGRAGGEVMVFTWGSDAKCYWGYVTINPRDTSPPGR